MNSTYNTICVLPLRGRWSLTSLRNSLIWRTRGQKRIHINGSSNKQAGGAGIVLHSPEGVEIECIVRLDFPTTNNEAEYETLVAGLDLAKAIGATSVVVHCDSQVITNQVNGNYECKGERMKKYLEQVKKRVNNL